MIRPSDKHMETARKVLAVVEAMPSSGNAHFIAVALATAEQEGMRRAAEIARLYGEAAWSLPGELEVAAGICSRILSQANSHSPDTLPVEADSAGEATSSSRASPAVPFPWQGRGFNPDSVG